MKSKEKKKVDNITEFICNECEGTGEDVNNPLVEGAYLASCPKCQGTGYLNWIDNILGKKRMSLEAFRKYLREVSKSI